MGCSNDGAGADRVGGGISPRRRGCGAQSKGFGRSVPAPVSEIPKKQKKNYTSCLLTSYAIVAVIIAAQREVYPTPE